MLRDESKVLAHLNPQVRLGHPAIMGMDCVVLGQLPGNESERERERKGEKEERRRGGDFKCTSFQYGPLFEFNNGQTKRNFK